MKTTPFYLTTSVSSPSTTGFIRGSTSVFFKYGSTSMYAGKSSTGGAGLSTNGLSQSSTSAYIDISLTSSYIGQSSPPGAAVSTDTLIQGSSIETSVTGAFIAPGQTTLAMLTGGVTTQSYTTQTTARNIKTTYLTTEVLSPTTTTSSSTEGLLTTTTTSLSTEGLSPTTTTYDASSTPGFLRLAILGVTDGLNSPFLLVEPLREALLTSPFITTSAEPLILNELTTPRMNSYSTSSLSVYTQYLTSALSTNAMFAFSEYTTKGARRYPSSPDSSIAESTTSSAYNSFMVNIPVATDVNQFVLVLVANSNAFSIVVNFTFQEGKESILLSPHNSTFRLFARPSTPPVGSGLHIHTHEHSFTYSHS